MKRSPARFEQYVQRGPAGPRGRAQTKAQRYVTEPDRLLQGVVVKRVPIIVDIHDRNVGCRLCHEPQPGGAGSAADANQHGAGADLDVDAADPT